MSALLIPPCPPQSRVRAPVWTAFVGRRANNSVYGWFDDAFRSTWKTRRVLGYTVHVVSDPDAIGRVLLVLHRPAALWEEPDAFDPDRFARSPQGDAPLPVSAVRGGSAGVRGRPRHVAPRARHAADGERGLISAGGYVRRRPMAKAAE